MPWERMQSRIIELCSEDAYGSWELWWSLGAKEAGERNFSCNRFIETVQSLVREGKIIALRKDEHNQFSVVQLDRDRLSYEIQNSDDPKPHEYFWFDIADVKGRAAGTRYQYPDGRGVRVLPGNPSEIENVKRGDPIPLAGNPTLQKSG